MYGQCRGSPHTGDSCCEWANISLETAEFANYYLLSWQTSSFSLSLSLSLVLGKAFTAHTYGTLLVPFGPIIFRCDSYPCFSIKLLMKATINKAWVHRTDRVCRREEEEKNTALVPKREDDAGKTQMVS